MGLWVLLLIMCSTFTFLSDVGHITHTLCVFGLTVGEIDFDKIEFERIDFG